MKLVVSYDEIGIDNGFADNIASADIKTFRFLENQFPDWDTSITFDLNHIEYDNDNMECHINMLVTS
jgi:hypothetical protein